MKVALPLAALGLLSTVFLLPGDPGREAARGPGPEALRDLMRERSLRGPTYTAVTEDGGALTVTAQEARPRDGGTDLFDLRALSVTLDRADGGRARITAESGVVDGRAQEGVFLGAVEVSTSDGYTLRTERLEATLDGARAVSPGPVRIETPDMTIEAGTMRATSGADGAPAGRILFNGGVRLVYMPPEAARGARPDSPLPAPAETAPAE